MCCLGFVSASMLQAATGTEEKLEKLRSVYDSSLKKCETQYVTRKQNWPEQYLASLDGLRQKFQKAGNLDGWSAVDKEIKRFRNAGTITKQDIDSAPEFINAVQSQYQGFDKTAEQDKSKQILALRDKYVAYLTNIQTSLTKDGRIEEALMVKSEVERVNKSGAVTAAEFMLAASTPQEPESGVSDEPAKPQPKATPDKPATEKAAEPVKTSIGAIIYPAGTHPPSDNNMVYKRSSLSRTDRSTLSAGLSVNCWEGGKRSSSTRSYSSSYSSYSSTRKSTSESRRIRLSIGASQTGVEFPLLHVYTEFFTKPARAVAGRIKPARSTAHHVKLENIGKPSVYIDLPTFSATSQRTSGYYGRSTTGSGFYGCAISVFDGDGKFLFQGATLSQLKDYACSEAPNFSKQEIHDEYQRARDKYYELGRAYSASPNDPQLKAAYREAYNAYNAARKAYENISSSQ